MACINFPNTCPSQGDSEQVLLSKILQSINEGGGGGGVAGVQAITVNGGPNQTGVVSLTIPAAAAGVTSVNGDPGPAVLLDSGEVPEGANLYFTEQRVRDTPLTGFVAAPGTVTAADTVLSAFEKLTANAAAATLVNFTDETADADAVVWGNAGTTELIRAVGATSDLQFGPANIMTLRGSDGRLTLAGRASFNTLSTVGHLLTFTDASNSTSQAALTLTHTLSAGVGAAGMGVLLDFNLDSTTTPNTRASRWETVWTVATHATRNSTSTFFNFVAGTETAQLILGNNQAAGNSGLATAPSFTNRNDLDTGLWFPAANNLGFAAGGVAVSSLSTASQTWTRGSSDTNSFQLHLRKARGTVASPAIITSGDGLGSIAFSGYDGTFGYGGGASIRAVSSGTIAAARIPASLIFATGTDAGTTVVTDALSINNAQQVAVLAGSFSTKIATLTDAATIATNAALGNHFRVTLGGNRTLGNPTNPTDGQVAKWEFIQDGTGTRTIAFDTKFNFGTDLPSFTLSTAAGTRDYILAIYNLAADVWDIVAGSHGF